MGIKCCYGCVPPKRYPGCGATCPEYIKEKAEDAAKKEAYYKERRLTGEIRQMRKDRYARYLQHRGRRK